MSIYIWILSCHYIFVCIIIVHSKFKLHVHTVVSVYMYTVCTVCFFFLQRFIGVLLMMIGVASYGYIIATTAASLANADSGRAKYHEKVKAVQNYLQVNNGCIKHVMYLKMHILHYLHVHEYLHVHVHILYRHLIWRWKLFGIYFLHRVKT